MFGKNFDNDISIDELLVDNYKDNRSSHTDNDKDEFDSILKDFMKSENSNSKSVDSLNDLNTLLNIDEINSSTSELFSLEKLGIDSDYKNHNEEYNKMYKDYDNLEKDSSNKIEDLEKDINYLWKMSEGISNDLSQASNDSILKGNKDNMLNYDNDIFESKIRKEYANFDDESKRDRDNYKGKILKVNGNQSSKNSANEFDAIKKEILSLAKKIKSDKNIINLFSNFLNEIEELPVYKDNAGENYNFISRKRDYIYESIKDVKYSRDADLKKLEVLRDRFYSIKEKM